MLALLFDIITVTAFKAMVSRLVASTLASFTKSMQVSFHRSLVRGYSIIVSFLTNGKVPSIMADYSTKANKHNQPFTW